MRSWLVRAALAATMASAAVPQAAPVGPVINGEFELAAEALKPPACALLGNTSVELLPPNLDPRIPDPLAPGDDIAWPAFASVEPCEAEVAKALQWSSSRATQFFDDDLDGDREAVVDGSAAPDAHHNFWQDYLSAHQAYMGDFQALRFRVEAGSVPSGAYVQLLLSAKPFTTVSPWLVTTPPWAGNAADCSLTFRNLTAAGGLVNVDPVTADFRSEFVDCNSAKSAWDAGNAAARHTILSRLRIVQLSFWRFQTGDPIRIDGIELVGGRTVVGI